MIETTMHRNEYRIRFTVKQLPEYGQHVEESPDAPPDPFDEAARKVPVEATAIRVDFSGVETASISAIRLLLLLKARQEMRHEPRRKLVVIQNAGPEVMGMMRKYGLHLPGDFDFIEAPADLERSA